jgi:hypothetical protein
MDIYWSGRSAQARIHLNPRCTGLERSIVHPREFRTLQHATVPSLAALAKASAGEESATREKLQRLINQNSRMYPCRACALEPVVDAVMKTAPRTGVFVTFSALPSHGVDASRYDDKDVTESAVARLGRIASRAGLSVTHSRIGPVAFGIVRPGAIAVIAANMRTLPPAPRAHSAREVSVVWSLVDDAANGGTPLGDYDPWYVAACI